MIEIITHPAILAVLISGLIAFQVQRFISFRSAANKFAETFFNELKGIYPKPENWPENIDHFLRTRFPTLQAAIEEFKNILPWYKRKAFDKAWFRYRCSTGREIDTQCYHHYMPFITTSIVDGKEVTVDNSGMYTETFKHNVDALLKFAKKT